MALLVTGPEVFTAIVGAILGGPASAVHGTDGRHHVVYELLLANTKAVPATLQAVEVVDPEHDAALFRFAEAQLLGMVRTMNAGPASNLDLPPNESRLVLLSLDFPSAAAVPRRLDHRIEGARGDQPGGQGAIVDHIPCGLACARDAGRLRLPASARGQGLARRQRLLW